MHADLPVGQNTPDLVNPRQQKYSALPKFGIAAFSRHPGPRRGAIVRRNERGSGCGGRGCVRHEEAGPGRDEPREVGFACRRTAPTSGEATRGKPDVSGEAPRGEAGSCVRQNHVVLTVVATVKPCGDGSGSTGFGDIVNSRGDGGQKELGSGESRHKPSNHRAGKAECSASPVCCCAVSLRYIFAQRTAGARRHPVFPAPSSQRRAKEESKTRAFRAARMPICA